MPQSSHLMVYKSELSSPSLWRSRGREARTFLHTLCKVPAHMPVPGVALFTRLLISSRTYNSELNPAEFEIRCNKSAEGLCISLSEGKPSTAVQLNQHKGLYSRGWRAWGKSIKGGVICSRSPLLARKLSVCDQKIEIEWDPRWQPLPPFLITSGCSALQAEEWRRWITSRISVRCFTDARRLSETFVIPTKACLRL